MGLARDKVKEFFKLLDENKLELAAKKLTMFSKDEIKELILETRMLDRIIKGKIKLLKYDLLPDHL